MRRIRSGVLLLVVAALSGVAVSQAKAYERLTFDITQQPLSAALRVFAEQAHVQILRRDEDVSLDAIIAPPVAGEFSTAEALGRLLSGSGVGYEFVNERTVRLVDTDREEGPDSVPSEKRRLSATSSQPATNAEKSAVPAAGTRSSARETEQAPNSTPNRDEGTGERAIQQVVVTAQKREETVRNVPISISVLRGADLDRSNTQGVTEELTRVPGVSAFPYNQGGGTFMAVRGVTASYPVFAGSSPIAYYLDGVPFGLVDTAIAPDASAYDLARVEVLRGPQGTLYGASASNGVVRVLTNDADLNNFDIKLRGSRSDTGEGSSNYRGDMAVNAPLIAGKLGARAVLGYQSLSGWIDTPVKQDANDALLRNARLKIDAQPTDQFSIGLSGWISHQDYGAPSIADDEGKTVHLVPDERTSTDYGVYGVKLGYEFTGVSVSSTTSYLNYANHDQWDFGVDYIAPTFSYPILESFHAHVVSEEINLNSTQGAWRWTAGAIYRDGRNTTFQTLPSIVTLDWTNTSRSYAAFGEISRRFLDGRLEWTVGGRYFHDDVTTKENPAATLAVPDYRADASFNSTTPRTVLTWHPVPNSTIYGSYSEGFRSGAPQPYYITGGVPGVPPVKPDKLHNYEIGAKADLLDRRISVDAAVYYMDWKDVQQQLAVPFLNTFVSAVVNGQSASGPGADLGLVMRPLDRLELGASFSWNDLTVDSDVLSAGKVLFAKGDRLNFSAKYTASASANYALPLGGSGYTGRFSASANYSSALQQRAILANQVRTTAGDDMVNVRASLSVQAPSHWEATVFGDNLTNEQGAVFRNALSANPDTSVRVRPRTIGVQFDYNY